MERKQQIAKVRACRMGYSSLVGLLLAFTLFILGQQIRGQRLSHVRDFGAEPNGAVWAYATAGMWTLFIIASIIATLSVALGVWRIIFMHVRQVPSMWMWGDYPTDNQERHLEAVVGPQGG